MDEDLLARAQEEVERIERFVADGHCTATVPQVQYLCNLGCSLEQLRGINKATASAMISQLKDAQYEEEYPLDDSLDVRYEPINAVPYIPNMEPTYAPSPPRLTLPPPLPQSQSMIDPSQRIALMAGLIIAAGVLSLGWYFTSVSVLPKVATTQESFDYSGLDPAVWRARMYDAKSKGKDPYWPTERQRQSNIVLPNLVRGGIYSINGALEIRSRMSENPEDDGQSWSSMENVPFQCLSVEEYNGLLFYGVRAYRFDGPADGFIEASQLAYVTTDYDRTDKILTHEDMALAEAQRIAEEQNAAIAQANAEHIANNQAAAQSRGIANNRAKADAARDAAAAQDNYRARNAETSRQNIERARANGLIR